MNQWLGTCYANMKTRVHIFRYTKKPDKRSSVILTFLQGKEEAKAGVSPEVHGSASLEHTEVDTKRF